jgi:hypothetical protein
MKHHWATIVVMSSGRHRHKDAVKFRVNVDSYNRRKWPLAACESKQQDVGTIQANRQTQELSRFNVVSEGEMVG